MKDEYYPQDFTIIDAGITIQDAVLKYPDSRILMMNLRYLNDDDDSDKMKGDIFLVGDDNEEFSRIVRRLRGFGGIGDFCGENITMASLGLRSLR